MTNEQNKTSVTPSPLVQMVWKDFPQHARCLDLGCGKGNDALFLAQQGFRVDAIDISADVVQRVRNAAEEKRIAEELNVKQADVASHRVPEGTYDVIICRNVLHFLPKTKALSVLKNLQHALKPSGFLIISVFTEDDPTFSAEKGKKYASYFERQELLTAFRGWNIIFLYEHRVLDPSHPGAPKPHEHGVARIVAKKLEYSAHHGDERVVRVVRRENR
ncbi:MAG: class I SAM-dependent methyltransferase [Parcubacteria group bacterium]